MYVVGTRLFQVDKWTSLTSGQVACNKRQGNKRKQVSGRVDKLDKWTSCL